MRRYRFLLIFTPDKPAAFEQFNKIIEIHMCEDICISYYLAKRQKVLSHGLSAGPYIEHS